MIDPLAETSLSRKIIRNTLFNFIGRFWNLIVTLLLTPYIVSKLGTQAYGAWSLIFVVVSYLGVLDLGVGTSFVKYVAEYHVKKEYATLNGLLSTGFIFYLGLSVPVIAVAFLFGDDILRLFKIPTDLMREAYLVLVLAAAILSLSNAFSIFQGVIIGLQRMDVTNIIAFAVSVPNIVGTILLLHLGYGLRGLIANEALIFALTAILLMVVSFRLFPELKVHPSFCSRASLRKLVNYGAKVQVTQLADLASYQMGKVWLGFFVGLNSVTFFELGSKVALTGKRLSRVMISAVMPAASEIEAKQDEETLRQLYLRGSKYLALVASPLMLFLAFAAPLLVRAWMGPGYELSVLVVQALSLGYLAHLLAGVGTAIIKGVGKPEYETQYTLLLLFLEIVLGIALVIKLGFVGVLIATPLALTLSSLYFMVLFHRFLEMSLVQFARDVFLKPIVASLLAGMCFFVVYYVLSQFLLLQGRMVCLGVLALGGLVFTGAYFGLIWYSRYLDEYDKRLMVVPGLVREAVIRLRS